MGKLRIVHVGLLLIAMLAFACEKVPVDSKVYVERYLSGPEFTRWPIRSYVKLTIKKTDTLVKDTIDLAIDTAIFNKNLQFIRGNNVVNFNVDAAGENITFSTKPDSTWHIDYLRSSSFKLSHERRETVNDVVTTYKIEQVFRR